MGDAAALRAQGISAGYNGARVLRGVSFEIRSGQLVSIVGPNGSGKSTLLKVLDGLVPVAAGTVAIDGREVGSLPRREVARRISYVPQGHAGDASEFSVRSFVEMARYPHLGAWSPLGREDREAVVASLQTTEMEHLAERSLAALSGGERQRAHIAAALAQGGRTLLLDEPTSALDYRHQVQVLDLLVRLHADEGYTVVVVTHDLNTLVPASDRVVALKDGRVVFNGPPAEFIDAATLEGIYDNPFDLVPHREGALPLVAPRVVPGRSRAS
jgi:iron complex transport system ATP-binding protein